MEDKEVERLIEKGIELYNNQEYEDATDYFGKVLEINNNNIVANYYSGFSKGNLGDIKGGVENLNKVSEDSELFPEALVRIALSYKYARKWDKVIEVLKKMPTSVKEYETAISETILAYYQLGKSDEAKDLFNNLSVDIRSNGEILHTLGHYEDKSGNKEAALSYYEQISSDSSAYGKGLVGRSRIYEEQGNMDKAIEMLALIPTRDNEFMRGFNDRVDILTEQNKIDEALVCFDDVPKEYEKYMQLMMKKACILANHKRFEEAISVLESSITEEANELYIDSLDKIGMFYRDLGNKEQYKHYKLTAQELEKKWFMEGRVSSYIDRIIEE